MAHIRRVFEAHRLGIESSNFMMSVIENLSDNLEKMDNDRRLHVLTQSIQSIQRGDESGDYEPIVITRVCEDFEDAGVVCIAYCIQTGKGMMADALEPEILDAITSAVQSAAEDHDHISMVGSVIEHGHVSEQFTKISQSGLDDVMEGLLNLLNNAPSADDPHDSKEKTDE